MDYLWWALILLALGLLFLVLEFFLPSSGILGTLCALSIIGAVVVGFMAGPVQGSAILVAVMIVVPAALGLGVRYWPHTPIGRLMLIQRPESPDEVLPETAGYRLMSEMIGSRGLARSLMLPSGVVEIDKQMFDAVSEGMAIDPGQPVVVVGVDTQRLVVRPDTSIVAAQFADQTPADPLAAEIADPFAES